MKKIICLALVIMLLSLTVGCGAVNEAPTDSSSSSSVTSSLVDTEYTQLKYEGLDVNPEKSFSKYVVDNDKEFINKVWDSIQYSEWKEKSANDSAAMVAINLRFISEDEVFIVSVDACDIACLYEMAIPDEFMTPELITQPNPVEESYFDLPKGTYKQLSELLTDYTERNFMDS